MIKRDDLVKIGKVIKTHGVFGELSCILTEYFPEDKDVPCLICCIEGIFVPFFIESYRFKSDTSVIVKFEDIDNELSAEPIIGNELYLEKKYIEKDLLNNAASDDLIGFEVIVDGNNIGKITSIDDTTLNILFTVFGENGKEYLIPAISDLIDSIDEENKLLYMTLPDGLLDF